MSSQRGSRGILEVTSDVVTEGVFRCRHRGVSGTARRPVATTGREIVLTLTNVVTALTLTINLNALVRLTNMVNSAVRLTDMVNDAGARR